MNINQKIATELSIKLHQVDAAVALLDEGATVPFIARYRKEVTQGLDDTQLRHLQERLIYLRELLERRTVIFQSIEEQGKMTDVLKDQLLAADTKARLEDLYLPYKPKRKTKAMIAKEAGLEPLANDLLAHPDLTPENEAAKYINTEKEIPTAAVALEGARYILMERFSEEANVIQVLRDYMWQHALLTAEVKKDKQEVGIKFKDYFSYQESLEKIPSHRVLAIFRGAQEEILNYQIKFIHDHDELFCLQQVADAFHVNQLKRAADAWLWQTVEWAWQFRLKTKLEVDLIMQLRERAEEQAIAVFRNNLKNLLMAAPAGRKNTLGLDPGLRTGVKVVVVDDTGKLLTHKVIFPHPPQHEWSVALNEIVSLCEHFKVDLISIGNGTGSRETERLVQEAIRMHPHLKLTSLIVSEAGASVYSASELAAAEFPSLDVSYRGAVSIARRLQDPLAELVKIDPKSIGVGQYQHDVNGIKLTRNLNTVVEDCVNAVGVDINTASIPLLKRVSGLNETIARNIVEYRETHGRFKNREAIRQVPRLGDKTYEQSIGFLRILQGDNPLDASAVHPESYPVVEKILQKTGVPIQQLLANVDLLNKINPREYVNEKVGEMTIKDILEELKKPGRDPRPEFKTVQFKEGVETMSDLKVGMLLEGMVTNVANFGAFVDIGVHQDGLVHVSQLARRYVSDPHQVVKVGQLVKVKVLEVDLSRKRIQLTMNLDEDAKKPEVVLNKKNKSTVEKKFSSAFSDVLTAALENGSR